jgi:hypothetical protein
LAGAAVANGAATDGTAAGADVPGDVGLGVVVVGAAEVEGDGAVVGALVVVVVLVSAPAAETVTTDSPRTVAPTTATRAPTREKDVL